MGTALIYLVVVVVVAAVVYALAVAVFGRGEELPPLPEGETPTGLPTSRIGGDHVRALRFPQAMRGYRMGEVDWVLERLAGEIDRVGAERDALAARLRDLEGGDGAAPEATTPTGGWVLPEDAARAAGRHSLDPREPDATEPDATEPDATDHEPEPAGDPPPAEDRDDPHDGAPPETAAPPDDGDPRDPDPAVSGGRPYGAHHAPDAP